MAAGEVHLGFIGGAEIDRYGNLNTSVIGDWKQPKVRLPGSGGGADIASLSQRLAIIMPHDEYERFMDIRNAVPEPPAPIREPLVDSMMLIENITR